MCVFIAISSAIMALSLIHIYKKIYLVDTFFERDYTAGKAKSILDSLILKESVKQISRDSLIDLIEQEKI